MILVLFIRRIVSIKEMYNKNVQELDEGLYDALRGLGNDYYNLKRNNTVVNIQLKETTSR